MFGLKVPKVCPGGANWCANTGFEQRDHGPLTAFATGHASAVGNFFVGHAISPWWHGPLFYLQLLL